MPRHSFTRLLPVTMLVIWYQIILFHSIATEVRPSGAHSAENPLESSIFTGITTRISVDSSGNQGNAPSDSPSISADGRYVVFESYASNLVISDTNNAWDVFVHDQRTGETRRISVSTNGEEGEAASAYPAISANGRYVAFESDVHSFGGGNLYCGGLFVRCRDIFVHDLETGETRLASVADNEEFANGASTHAAISADGRYIAFQSSATNLVDDNDTNNVSDIFVRDMVLNTTRRVSVADDGAQPNGASLAPSISASGTVIAFHSAATNLISSAVDTNNEYDVFVRELSTERTYLISVANNGSESIGSSTDPSISGDGRYVAFVSTAENLLNGDPITDTNQTLDIFLRDRQLGHNILVSVASDGTQGNDFSRAPDISLDGCCIAFASLATNLIPNDTTTIYADIFVRDVRFNTTTRASESTEGQGGTYHNERPTISGDGRYIAFDSASTNLVPNDTNLQFDAFIHDRGEVGYAISGNITDRSRTPLSGVVVELFSGKSATTDLNGAYRLAGLITGTYTLTPSLAGYVFRPFTLTASVPPSRTDQNFAAIYYGGAPVPFLDLPFPYGSTRADFVLALQNWNMGGRINSWFDHKHPDYSEDNGTGIWIYNNRFSADKRWQKDIVCYGAYCYDGHNGLDFSYADPEPHVSGDQPLPILASANGTVVSVCPSSSDQTCQDGYGRYVVLSHTVSTGNNYFTLYGHLATISNTITPNATVTRGTSLGIMGSSGHSSGPHLHFGVYRDDGDAIWEGPGTEKVVDPFEWQLQESGLAVLDPWVTDRQGPPSYRLWLQNPAADVTFPGALGGVITDSTETVLAMIPPNAFGGEVTLEIEPGPVQAGSADLREAGQSFTLRRIEPEGTAERSMLGQSSEITSGQAITLAVTYNAAHLFHLSPSLLSIYAWDETSAIWQPLTSTVYVSDHRIMASTQQLGAFSVRAPLLCPADQTEPDDRFYQASVIEADGTAISRTLDVMQDVDWFTLDAVAGKQYLIKTKDLSPNVVTALRLYDMDGLTLLASGVHDNSEPSASLRWQASATSSYFIQIRGDTASMFGCDSHYSLTIISEMGVYLPLILR